MPSMRRSTSSDVAIGRGGELELEIEEQGAHHQQNASLSKEKPRRSSPAGGVVSYFFTYFACLITGKNTNDLAQLWAEHGKVNVDDQLRQLGRTVPGGRSCTEQRGLENQEVRRHRDSGIHRRPTDPDAERVRSNRRTVDAVIEAKERREGVQTFPRTRPPGGDIPAVCDSPVTVAVVPELVKVARTCSVITMRFGLNDV